MAQPSATSKFDERFFLQSQEDLPFEEDIVRNPYSVRHWLRYIDHKKLSNGSFDSVNMLYERCLKQVPGSYKVWIRYLRYRLEQIEGRPISDAMYDELNNCFERSLVFMHKMPRVWEEYLTTLTKQCFITRTRRTFDRALQALPVTQHNRIWPLYIDFIQLHDISETAIRVYKRYLKLQPEFAENYIDYVRRIGRLDEAAVKLADIVKDDKFISREGKSKFMLWSDLCELICRNPGKVISLPSEAIIREGIRRFTDQQGKLWILLAEYFTRSGLFERARDVYEEAMASVSTIRDFSQVFDAYAQSEERIINAKMETQGEEDDDGELDLRLARYEDLIERRPLLLNAVALRQNPHNVEEWLKRVTLLEGRDIEIINTFMKAVSTVEPKQATGKFYTIWVEFAKFYESHGQLEDARVVFDKATQVEFSKVDDLANVWCEFAEMELRNGNPKGALRLMERATAAPSKKTHYWDQSESVQNRLYKSLKLWSLYADLEESFGTLQTTKAVYDRIIDLKIATPQIIINYGMFLHEHNYFEDAFRAYEKGIDLFKFPLVYDIWNTYLTKFLERYGGSKLERARDLFEQCLSECPSKFAKTFYLLYAKLEEEHGLVKHAMSIYDRATAAVEQKDQLEIFNVYIKKATQLLGITHTRAIYEKAIECLPDDQAREMGLRYADLERKLGEIDRARGIYSHCSQMCDPRTCSNFWNTWKDFEIKHGNEDTIREMLRIKRSVQATFNTQVNFLTSQMVAASSNDTMKELEQQVLSSQDKSSSREDQENQSSNQTAPLLSSNGSMNFVKSSQQVTQPQVPEASVNPDEIDLDEEGGDDGEEEEDGDVSFETKSVPKEVFGGLMPSQDDE